MGNGCTYLVEHVLQLVLGEGAALDVLDGAEVLGHALAVLFPHRLHLLFGELIAHARVLAKVDLGAHDEAGDARAVVVDLGKPLLPDVFKGSGGGDREAHEENVGLGVGQGSQAVVVLLTGGIEQSERVGLVSDPEEVLVSTEIFSVLLLHLPFLPFREPFWGFARFRLFFSCASFPESVLPRDALRCSLGIPSRPGPASGQSTCLSGSER